MESALGWLQSIFDTILKLFPRLLIVGATHGGVKFVRGSKVVELKPGLHLYWPIVTEIETYCVVRQVIDLPTYTLTTKDYVKCANWQHGFGTVDIFGDDYWIQGYHIRDGKVNFNGKMIEGKK